MTVVTKHAINSQSRTIDGVSIRFAESELRGSKSASTTSSASSRCWPGLRVRARTLNCPPTCRARTTAPPCCPDAPITAISLSFWTTCLCALV